MSDSTGRSTRYSTNAAASPPSSVRLSSTAAAPAPSASAQPLAARDLPAAASVSAGYAPSPSLGAGSTGMSPAARPVSSGGGSEPATVERLLPPWLRALLLNQAVVLTLLVLAWYGSSTVSNTLSSVIVRKFPAGVSSEVSLTMVQFLFIVVCSFAVLRSSHGATANTPIPLGTLLRRVAPLSFGHVVTNYLTNLSMRFVPQSFTHTIKSSSPLFTLVLSYLILGETFERVTVLSLIPNVAGMILCTFTEANFHWIGFLAALGSTAMFSVQNVYSKKLFRDDRMEVVTLLMYTGLCSSVMMLPMWLAWEAPQLIYSGNIAVLFALVVFNGLSHFLQNILAFSVLSRMAPLSYSVANTFKRIATIVFGIFWQGNRVSPTTTVGIALAVLGGWLYSYTRHHTATHAKSHKGMLASALGGGSTLLPLHRLRQNEKESRGLYV